MSFDDHAYHSYMYYQDSLERAHKDDYHVIEIVYFNINDLPKEVEDIELNDVNDYSEAYQIFRNEVVKRVFNYQGYIEARLIVRNDIYDVADGVACFANSEFSDK